MPPNPRLRRPRRVRHRAPRGGADLRCDHLRRLPGGGVAGGVPFLHNVLSTEGASQTHNVYMDPLFTPAPPPSVPLSQVPLRDSHPPWLRSASAAPRPSRPSPTCWPPTVPPPHPPSTLHKKIFFLLIFFHLILLFLKFGLMPEGVEEGTPSHSRLLERGALDPHLPPLSGKKYPQ